VSNGINDEQRKRLHVELGRAIANYRALLLGLSPPSHNAVMSAIRRIANVADVLADGATPAQDISTLDTAIAAYGSEPSQAHAAAVATVARKIANDDGMEIVSLSESIPEFIAAYEANLVGEYARQYVVVPVSEAQRFGLDYDDLGTTPSPREHVRRLRVQQRLPAYPPGERLQLFDEDVRPVDCFRCHGDVEECPLHSPNWRACPHAMK